jgi:quercetin dioxygenase-like cupin family protein
MSQETVKPPGKRRRSMNEDRSQSGTAVALLSEDGEARWWFGALVVIKATAKDTGGQLAVVEVTEPPGAEAPLHVHHREDEAFWVLDGDVTFEVGDTTFEATSGDFAFGPRDVPHRYEVGDAGCRLLFMLTPAGFEELLMKMSEPAASRTLPPPPESEPDMEQIQGLGKAYGIEMLG